MRTIVIAVCVLVASVCFGKVHDRGGTGIRLPAGTTVDGDTVIIQSPTWAQPAWIDLGEVQQIIWDALECIDGSKMERGSEKEKQECYKAMNRLRDLSVRLREINGGK